MMLKAILFDLDDTLYREYDYVQSGFAEVAKYLSNLSTVDVPEQIIQEYLLKTLQQKGRGKIFNEALQWLGLDEDKYVTTLLYIYRNHIPKNLKLNPSMQCLLEDLLEHGFKLGLITDGIYVTQRNKTDVLLGNISFDCIIHTDSLGVQSWKPSSTPFLVACNLLHVNPQECVYVGDNPVKDFKGAKSAGMQALWWNPQNQVYAFPDYISSPDMVAQNIEALRNTLLKNYP